MSNSQKFINVVSILNIIGGIAYLVIGLLGAFGVGGVGTERLVEHTGEQTAGVAAWLFIVIMILVGGFSLFTGILGTRAAHDASKIGPVFTLATISLIISVVNVVVSIIDKDFGLRAICSLVGPALMLWCAANVKKQNQ